jgi:hypothetical protein
MLQSAVPQSLSWMNHVSGSQPSNLLASDSKGAGGMTQILSLLLSFAQLNTDYHSCCLLFLYNTIFSVELQQNDSRFCPPSVPWTSDGLEKDLHIQSNLVTVLAMDGRRRWLDIKKLVGEIVLLLLDHCNFFRVVLTIQTPYYNLTHPPNN